MKIELSKEAAAALSNALTAKTPKGRAELRPHSRVQRACRVLEREVVSGGYRGTEAIAGALELDKQDVEYVLKEVVLKQIDTGVQGHFAQGFAELLDVLEAADKPVEAPK